TNAHIFSALARPSSPVAALAFPDEMITAPARPPLASRWARLTDTGAAAARLPVKTPAAGTARPSSVATRARSSAPDALIPQASPAATNPSGAVILMPGSSREDPHDRESGRLVPPVDHVDALNGLARRALAQIVEGTEDEDPPRPLFDPGRELRRVRPEGGLGRRRLLRHRHEGGVGVVLLQDPED